MIDLIFTNTVDKIVCSGVSHVGISDHSLVYAFRKLSTGLSTIGHTTEILSILILNVSEMIFVHKTGMI